MYRAESIRRPDGWSLGKMNRVHRAPRCYVRPWFKPLAGEGKGERGNPQCESSHGEA